MKSLAMIINEEPYEFDPEEQNGLLNCSSGRISDFKVTLISAIIPEYTYFFHFCLLQIISKHAVFSGPD